MIQTDAFIVGGGPAGLAAAIALRAKGLDVLVADASVPPIDKACGEGLMPDALVALQKLGVCLNHKQSATFHGICFLQNGARVSAKFPEGQGLGIRRSELHQALIERAGQAGVHLLWGTPVKSFSPNTAALADEEVSYRWLIGADGEHSRVRKWAGLDCTRVGLTGRRFGFRQRYHIEPWSQFVEVYWCKRGQIYVTPVGPREVSVAWLTRSAQYRLDHALLEFPELRERLTSIATAERGAISASRTLSGVYRDHTVLLGDASGSVDAITGEGLRLCFEQSLALAEAISSNDLPAYQRAHRKLSRRPNFMAAQLLLLDRLPVLRRGVLRVLAAQPGLFSAQLALHVGAPRDILVTKRPIRSTTIL